MCYFRAALWYQFSVPVLGDVTCVMDMLQQVVELFRFICCRWSPLIGVLYH